MDGVNLVSLFNNLVAVMLLTIMFSVGLNLKLKQASSLLRDPVLLARSFVSVVIIFPVVAITIIMLLPLSQEARLGLGLLAVVPGAPMLASRVAKAEGSFHYAASLQLTVSVLAVITVPLTLAILSSVFSPNASASLVHVGRQVALVQLLPIGLGLLIREFFAELADTLLEPIAKLGKILFLVVTVMALGRVFNLFLNVNPILVAATVVIVILGLTIGHYLGGRDLDIRKGLAIGTIARNIGLAIFLANYNFPELDLLPTILLYLILANVVEAVYKALLKRRAGAATA